MLFIKHFQRLSPVLIFISHENTLETLLTLKKCRLAKFCKVDVWCQALLFSGETSFSSFWFFFNIPEISAQIQKLTKYLSSQFSTKSNNSAKNNVISPNFLVWKFCGRQFPNSFGQILQSDRPINCQHLSEFFYQYPWKKICLRSFPKPIH